MILTQKDPRWANIHLGTSNYYIWAKGCLLTELAEILNTTPDIVNEKLNNVGGFAPDTSGQTSLLKWKSLETAFPGTHVNRVWTYDNTQVLAELAAGNGVVVEVPSDPIGMPGGKHWVRYIGNHQLHDPWTGVERPTSDFPNPTGYATIVLPKVETTVASENNITTSNQDLAAISAALGIDPSSTRDLIIEHINTLKKNFQDQLLATTKITPSHIEGQGPAIIPAITLANLPIDQKDILLQQLQNTTNEIRRLLGL